MEAATFVVDIKDTAVEHNEAVADYRENVKNPARFESREAAVEMARKWTEQGGSPVKLQEVAPQDQREIDAYLVPGTGQNRLQPIASHKGQWAFEPTGNQFGAIAETLILSYSRDPPPLRPYIEEDLDRVLPEISHLQFDSVDEFDLHVKIDPSPGTVSVEEGDNQHQWRPDCVAEAWVGYTGNLLRRYWCEIKSGNASFRTSQLRAMEKKAESEQVLKVRIDIDGLPDRYSVSIDKVE